MSDFDFTAKPPKQRPATFTPVPKRSWLPLAIAGAIVIVVAMAIAVVIGTTKPQGILALNPGARRQLGEIYKTSPVSRDDFERGLGSRIGDGRTGSTLLLYLGTPAVTSRDGNIETWAYPRATFDPVTGRVDACAYIIINYSRGVTSTRFDP